MFLCFLRSYWVSIHLLGSPNSIGLPACLLVRPCIHPFLFCAIMTRGCFDALPYALVIHFTHETWNTSRRARQTKSVVFVVILVFFSRLPFISHSGAFLWVPIGTHAYRFTNPTLVHTRILLFMAIRELCFWLNLLCCWSVFCDNTIVRKLITTNSIPVYRCLRYVNHIWPAKFSHISNLSDKSFGNSLCDIVLVFRWYAIGSGWAISSEPL